MLQEFNYSRPDTLDEVLSIIAEQGDRTKVFSGGTDLFVDIRAGLEKPESVIDLKGVDSLHELSFDKKEGLSIGACVTINELIEYDVVEKHFPILLFAGRELATHQLRNRATVVGNIVTASPCGDMASPLLCQEAALVVTSRRDSKKIPFMEFITGVKKTVLQPDEIVEKIIVPTTMIDARGGYKKLKRIRGHDLGVVSTALIKRNGTLRIAISSAAPTPILLSDFPSDVSTETVQAAAQKVIRPIDDVRCSAEYRAFMVNIFIERLMEEVM
jgi:carbon-monoxide dehydrogenase medium subunit